MSTIAQLLVKIKVDGANKAESALKSLAQTSKTTGDSIKSSSSKAYSQQIADLNNLIKFEHQAAKDRASALIAANSRITANSKANAAAEKAIEKARIDEIRRATSIANAEASARSTLAKAEAAEMSSLSSRNKALAPVWESAERAKTAATKEHVSSVREEQKRLYESLKANARAEVEAKQQSISAEQAVTSATNNASQARIAASKLQTGSVMADLRKQIAAEYESLAAKISAARQSGTASKLFIAQSKAETASRVSDLKKQIATQIQAGNTGVKHSQWLSGLKTQLVAATAAYVSLQGAVRGFNATIEAAAQYQTLERQLEFLTGGSTREAAAELQYLTNISQQYGTVLLQSTEQYSALASAMKLSGVSMSGVHKTYEALSAVSATYALSQDKVNAIMLAFTQIAGKGRVQSEELVRQLGQYIPALQLGAQAMGMSIQEFNKALKAGTVASSEFLPKFSAVINEMYGKDLERKTDTITAAQNRFSTALSKTLKEIAENTGVAAAYKDVLEVLADQMQRAIGEPEAFKTWQQAATSAMDIVQSRALDTGTVLNKMALFGGGNAAFNAGMVGASVSEQNSSIEMTKQQLDSLRSSLDAMPIDDLKAFQAQVVTSFANIENPTESAIKKWSQLREVLHDALGKKTVAQAKEFGDSIREATSKSISMYDEMYSSYQKEHLSDREKAIPAWVTEGLASAKTALQSASDMLELRPTQAAQESYDEAKKTYDMAMLLQRAYYDKYDTAVNAALKSQVEQMRLATLSEKEQITAKYDLQVEKAKDAFGDNEDLLNKYLEYAKQVYDKDLEAFGLNEESKTEKLIKALGLRSIQTKQGIESKYSRGISEVDAAVSGGTISESEGEDLSVRLALQRNQQLAELEQERQSYASDAYEIRQDALIEALSLQEVTEQEFNDRSLENYMAYVEAMNQTASGARALRLSQMQTDSQFLGQASQIAVGLEQLAQEGSSTQKALFLASKGLAMAEIMINTERGAMAAIGQMGPFGIPMSAAIRALGYASIGLVAAQTVQQFATGGTLGQPRDTAPGRIYGPGTGTSDSIYFRGSKDESILTAAASRAIGYGAVNYINRYNQLPVGHADGYAAPYSAPIPSISSYSNVNVPIRITNTAGVDVTATKNTNGGQTSIDITVAQVKQNLMNELNTNNGPFANALGRNIGGRRSS